MGMHDTDDLSRDELESIDRENMERHMRENAEDLDEFMEHRRPRNDFERKVQWIFPLLVVIGCLVYYFFIWDGR